TTASCTFSAMIVLARTVNYPLAAEALRINTIANMKGVSAGSRAIRAVRRPIHSGFAPGPRARSTALDRSRYASSYSLIKYQIESTLKTHRYDFQWRVKCARRKYGQSHKAEEFPTVPGIV